MQSVSQLNADYFKHHFSLSVMYIEMFTHMDVWCTVSPRRKENISACHA